VADEFESAVIAVLNGLRPGEVVTYGEVATEAGYPGAARAVGNILRNSGGSLPWWRVVNVSGRLVPGHEAQHAQLLANEGVATKDGRLVRPTRAGSRRAGR